MVRVLDILEDYLVQRSHPYERIDGCIRGNERQMAIDRFCRKGGQWLACFEPGNLTVARLSFVSFAVDSAAVALLDRCLAVFGIKRQPGTLFCSVLLLTACKN